MKVMILAAGQGTRLKPMTDTMPKALVPIKGIPMLEHVILKVKAEGFTHIVINIHHFGEQIIDFLKSKNNFGLTIDISDERSCLLNTGGGIKQAKCFLDGKDDGDEPFLVHNVDIFSNVSLREMYRAHVESKAFSTLLVNRRQSSRQLLFDASGQLCGWQNRETGEVKSPLQGFDASKYSEYAFGGIYVVSPKVFPLMEGWSGKFSIIDFYLSVCSNESIRLYTKEGIKLIDAGKVEELEEIERFI